jgi:hypothetical protein
MVVDPGGVEARGADIREEMAEEAGARLGEFVQEERGAGKLGEDGEKPRAADGSRTWSEGTIAAAVLATRARGMGVENCWNSSLSMERRVLLGSSRAILVSIGSSATADPARAAMAPPNLRRNSTAAASQAS